MQENTKRLLNSSQIEMELLRQFSPPYLYIRVLTNHDVTYQAAMHQEVGDSATMLKTEGERHSRMMKRRHQVIKSAWLYG